MFEIIKKGSSDYKELITGIKYKNLAIGEKTHMVKFFLNKGSKLPIHNHLQEQTGYMIKGKMLLTIDDQTSVVNSGDSWSIGANVPHGAEVVEDCEVIEVFSPVRDDYIGGIK